MINVKAIAIENERYGLLPAKAKNHMQHISFWISMCHIIIVIIIEFWWHNHFFNIHIEHKRLFYYSYMHAIMHIDYKYDY